MKTPNCYKCVHRGAIPGDTHSKCNNMSAKVTGNRHGIKMGWFMWPINFDPVWLTSCDGFSDKREDALPTVDNPLLAMLGMLKVR